MRLIAVRLGEGIFPVDPGEAAIDGLVDFAFVTFGAALAVTVLPQSSLCASAGLCSVGDDCWDRAWHFLLCWGAGPIEVALSRWFGIVAGALVVFFLVARRPFLRQKRAFDKSGLPHYTRLPTFPANFMVDPAKLPALAESIDTFAAGSGAIRQLVVSGPPASGRTTLALAIGGEATTRRRKVRYLSATRLAEKTAYAWERASDVEQPWQVGEAELVIVDEIPVAMFAGPDIAAALGALVDCDWNSNRTSVFERPVGACVPQPDGSFPPPAGAVREMPQVVWVVDDQALADRLAAAIAARFPGAPLLHVRLARAIGSTRVMRAEG